MRNELLDLPSPLQTNLRAVARPRQARMIAPRMLAANEKNYRKALLAAEMAAWEVATVRPVKAVPPPTQVRVPRLPSAERSLSRGEKAYYGILTGGSLATLLVALNAGAALGAKWEHFVAWVQVALG